MGEVKRSREHAYARGTFSNLNTQFRSYFGFCVYFERDPLPASFRTVSGYVQFLSRTLKPQSIRNYLSGVKMLHIFLGYEYKFSDDFHLQLVFRGIDRLQRSQQGQACHPGRFASFSSIHGPGVFSSLVGVLLCVGSFLRVGETGFHLAHFVGQCAGHVSDRGLCQFFQGGHAHHNATYQDHPVWE